jgi:TetR/AcrR family transcriptional regulator, cholesterol catabolism regulator
MDIKTRILDQASQMFFRFGIRSITMDEIAESLGMSKRTLYENFATKEELLKECIEFQYRENIRLRDDIMRAFSDDPLEIFHQHFRHAMITLSSIHPNYITDLQKYYSTIWRKHIQSKQEENISFTVKQIEKGKEKGIFRQDVDAEIMSRAAHSGIQMMVSPHIFPETRFPRSEVFRQVTVNFIRGMATAEGMVLVDEKFKG